MSKSLGRFSMCWRGVWPWFHVSRSWGAKNTLPKGQQANSLVNLTQVEIHWNLHVFFCIFSIGQWKLKVACCHVRLPKNLYRSWRFHKLKHFPWSSWCAWDFPYVSRSTGPLNWDRRIWMESCHGNYISTIPVWKRYISRDADAFSLKANLPMTVTFPMWHSLNMMLYIQVKNGLEPPPFN